MGNGLVKPKKYKINPHEILHQIDSSLRFQFQPEYDAHSSNFRLRINRTPSFFATPHGMGHAKLGAGVPTSHPQHPQGLGLAKTIFSPFFWAKNGNLAMAKNGKLIACATPCGPLASCGPHPNGPKCAHGHQGGQGPTPCSPHGHPQIWQPRFQIWGVPHMH